MITLAMKLKRMGFVTLPDPTGEVEYVGWHELPYAEHVNSQTISIQPEHQNADYFIFYVMHRRQGVTCPNATLMDTVMGSYSPYNQRLAIFKATSGARFSFTFTSTSERALVGYAAFNGDNIGYLGAGDNFADNDVNELAVQTKNTSGVSIAAMSRVFTTGATTISGQLNSTSAGVDTRVAVGLFGNNITGVFSGGGDGTRERSTSKHSLNLYTKKSRPSNVQFLGYHETDPVRTGTNISIGILPEHQNADYILIFVQTRGVSTVTNETSDYIEEMKAVGEYATITKIYKAHAGVVAHTYTFNTNTQASMIGYAAFNGKNINYSSAKMNDKTQHSDYVEATTMTSEQGVNIALMMKNYSNGTAGGDKSVAPHGAVLKSRATNKENQWLLFSLAIAEGNKIEGAWGHGMGKKRLKAAASMAINLRN